MKRIALPILLLGAVLMLAQCASRDERVGQTAQIPVSGGVPAAEFPSVNHDLGQIAEGREFSHVFVVRNTGDGVLQIKKVLPG